MSETIVVVGSRTDGSAHIYYYRDAASQTWYEIAIEEDGSSTTVALPEAPEVADDPEDQSDSVTVEVSDANRAEALKAAANIMAAIEKIKAALGDLDPGQVIWLNGTATTVGEQLALLENTQFVITDEYRDNGGVGAAIRNEEGGPHTVEFHFEAFDGDLDQNGNGDYASPNYTDMQGLVGIIGHEMGHLSDAGDRFYDQSLYWHDQQNERDNTRIEFEDGVYWTNRKSWAHAYSRDLAYATGQNLDGWNPDETFNWQPPNLIFNGGDAAYATSAQIEELQSKDPSEIDNMDCPSTYDYLM